MRGPVDMAQDRRARFGSRCVGYEMLLEEVGLGNDVVADVKDKFAFSMSQPFVSGGTWTPILLANVFDPEGICICPQRFCGSVAGAVIDDNHLELLRKNGLSL